MIKSASLFLEQTGFAVLEELRSLFISVYKSVRLTEVQTLDRTLQTRLAKEDNA